MNRKIFAADIGGTSSRFGAFEYSEEGGLQKIAVTWLSTKDAPSFGALLESLTQLPFHPSEADVVAIAAAGPVQNDTYCNPPNIDWDIDLTQFSFRRFGLINDFVAQAYACRSPLEAETEIVRPGTMQRSGTVGVIGAGTGLGKGILIPLPGGFYHAIPSEGGHANFCPQDERELSFAQFVAKRVGSKYPSWDDTVSGRGLVFLHEFLTGKTLTAKEVASQFGAYPETFEMFSRFYGRVCRNFALDTWCLGGLYIAGGVAAKNPAILSSGAFGEEFCSSVVHAATLASLPIRLVDNEEAGLWGAAFYGLQLVTR